MRSSNISLAAIAVAALVPAFPNWAMAQAAPDPHHPAEGTTTPDSQTLAGSAQPGMMGMTGMMDMMRMMQMMHRGAASMAGMAPQGMDVAVMPMTDHVEGRIAFLRAELKITDAQAGAWDDFANALRLQATKLAEARRTIGDVGAQPAGFDRRLAIQETLLSARLEGVRAIKATYGHLTDALTPEQRKAADELLSAHMGMGRGGMMPPMGFLPMEGSVP